ncbi:hypothetical protein P9314_05190 [Paenibacillus validus]|uniref:hypothetical protein n=1 Tax=Paenibacillus validus TaxID=44253 RepID=UPI000FDC5EB1|nr:hypothetical protein [Paenibacillus validus]MED4600104.1 hypothetical protein [Paenibacillus validus]MED4605552.1 hypothetical protein [Paenibacillus validus]
MIRRIAGRKDCGNCYRLFKPFETVHYLGIDNCSYCAECREKLRPGEKDDPHDHGGWVPALYIGFNEEGRNNILQLIKLWNEENQESYNLEHQIDVSK